MARPQALRLLAQGFHCESVTWSPSMIQLHPSLTTLQVVVTAFHIFAIIISTFRLAYRHSKHLLWWDDALTAGAMITDVMSLVFVWIVMAPPTYHESDQVLIAARWGMIFSFTTCLWLARLSIVFSIIRLASREDRMRKIARWAAVVFTGLCVLLLAQKTYVCADDESWLYHHDIIDCRLGSSVAAVQLATDFVSDIALVLMSIRLLREIHLPKDQHILIISVFSSSIIISLVSIVHVIFASQTDVYMQSITAQLELALSLIVCNLLVIVTYIYRIFRHEDLDTDRSYQASGARTRVFLTTCVDVNQVDSWSPCEESTLADTSSAGGKHDYGILDLDLECHSFVGLSSTNVDTDSQTTISY
ncbi:hypothetical protein K503DRAFT_461897 [Rhizopogon vinicolor AM-OR11-026]|uniref:Rhodopsin domain-containing protein n=1 Tax=Rhizopogon vinicolor AM-OR11-026 TaxID=1314800 RepID=A0A1B7NA03_9AGAM|nr:hypothetical protein K503DRAFT_461897 [Rhizopogon vinicolor AM-OR11-026]